MRRRQFGSILAASPLVLSLPARAQAWPSKLIRVIVPFAPGGSGDITARLVGRHIEEATGQTVVVETKPGANGVIGTEAAKNAAPDGYTVLLCTTSTNSANVAMFKSLPYDPEKDFTVCGVFGASGAYLLVKPDAPYKTLPELVAFAKANPGKIFYGYFNASSQVPGALLQRMAGIEMTGVPYKAIGNCFNDIMGGQIQAMFVDTTAGDSHVNQGQLRPLGVTRPARWDKKPDVPAIAEFYPGFELTGFLGMALPAATPRPICERLNALVNKAILSPDVKDRLESFGFTPKSMSLEECDAFSKSEREKWKRYVEIAGIEKQ